ncbi:hypothetical protein H0H81_008495 [Sphagnurus paluster]|uniref:Uncharacterized protein n=1 Tax=Sphagnurus paluster TaxID=117069 RepID=A0A9P7K334_9AGAR|nr:hypothetical protein H0H81_008495 [Sphagnurus paluster]
MFIKSLIPSFLPQASRLLLYILPMRQPPPPAPDIPPVVPRAPTTTFQTYIPPTLTKLPQLNLALSLTLLLAAFLFTSSLLVAVSLLCNRKCRIEAQHSTEDDSQPHSQPMCDDLVYDDPPLYDLLEIHDDPPLEDYPEVHDDRAEKLAALVNLVHASSAQYLINLVAMHGYLRRFQDVLALVKSLDGPPLYSAALEAEPLPTYKEALMLPKKYDVRRVVLIRQILDLPLTVEDREELATYRALVVESEYRVRNPICESCIAYQRYESWTYRLEALD